MQTIAKTSWVLRFVSDVVSCEATQGGLAIDVKGWRSLPLQPNDPAVANALQKLQAPGVSLEDLTGGVGEQGQSELFFYLNRLERIRVLEWAVLEQGQEIATLESLSATFHLDYTAPAEVTPLSLSRFALIRRAPSEGEDTPDHAVLESGASRARMILTAPAAERVADLAVNPQAQGADAIIDLLARAGLVESVTAEEPEERMPWEFHDRLFHEITRGLHETEAIGGTYRMKGVIPSPPAVVPVSTEQGIALPSPGRHESLPLDQVLAKRRSIRSYADEPIDTQQLSDLLYRVARTTGSVDMDPQDIISRPYPSGGSLHELQFYLAVWHCKGLERGIYRYVGESHQLVPVGGSEAQMAKLLGRSGAAMGQPEAKPQVLLILTTRHPRMAWKYQGMAYRATLMNVGVVFQTLYLVATDLGIAACANGAGDGRVFEEASGLNSWEESAIGEFALGRAA